MAYFVFMVTKNWTGDDFRVYVEKFGLEETGCTRPHLQAIPSFTWSDALLVQYMGNMGVSVEPHTNQHNSAKICLRSLSTWK